MEYEQMNKQIIQGVGGKENIRSVIHCATRLRFILYDESKADDKKIENIPGILQLVKSAGQYQIVIGGRVEDVYDNLADMLNLDDVSNGSHNLKKSVKNQSLLDRVIETVTGILSPTIPLLAGAGMGKVLLLILNMMGVLSSKSQTYLMLNSIFDTGYYFMPAFIGFSAAKVFKTNQILGAFIGLVTVNPDWVTMVAAGKPIHFLGLPVDLVSYSSTFIPAILSVWLMSYIEKWVKKITPSMIKVFVEPMLIILFTAPLTFLVIGPIANLISQGIANGSMFLYDNIGMIAIPILAGLYPWLVSMGVHKALSPISIQLLVSQGYDPIVRVAALCANMSQGAANLAVGLKTKNKKLRSLALSSSATAYLGGITEPAMFGVNLKLKKPMYGAMIGGAVAGVFAGYMKMKAFVYVTPGLLSLPMWVSKTENFILPAIMTITVSSLVTFVATWLIGFKDPVYDPDLEFKNNNDKKTDVGQKVKSPVEGRVVALDKVSDKTFASGIMGKGSAIIPTAGKVIAPADGRVEACFSTGHAIGIHLDNNADLLIHVGIDTVELKGKYFQTLVQKGERFSAGQELLRFDIEGIKKSGYDPTVIVIVLNSKDFLEVSPIPEAENEVTIDNNLLMLA